jgi:hypothetical protein
VTDPKHKRDLKTERANEAGEKPATFGAQLAALLDWIKPYKEIAALLIATIMALSGAVAWAVAHFATQAELFYLECRINSAMETQSLADRASALASAADARYSQIKQLAQMPSSAGTASAINQLASEINEIAKQQATHSAVTKTKMDEMTRRCSQEAPSQAASKK